MMWHQCIAGVCSSRAAPIVANKSVVVKRWGIWNITIAISLILVFDIQNEQSLLLWHQVIVFISYNAPLLKSGKISVNSSIYNKASRAQLKKWESFRYYRRLKRAYQQWEESLRVKCTSFWINMAKWQMRWLSPMIVYSAKTTIDNDIISAKLIAIEQYTAREQPNGR